MTLFIPDVSNNNWGSEELTSEGRGKLLNFLEGLPGSFAGLEHKMSQGANDTDPYGKIAQDWCNQRGVKFIGYHYATADNPSAQAANWIASRGGPNAMLDFEDVDDDENPLLTPDMFWSLVNAFNAAGVNVPLAYIPSWYIGKMAGGMDLSPLVSNGIQLISSGYPLGYSQGPTLDLYRGCGGDTGEGWQGYYGSSDPIMWQFSSTALALGISCDMNAFKGTSTQLANLFAV
jgi:hypothetical protein